MYLRRIVLVVLLLGLLGGGIFSYRVYQVLFAPNTSFSEEETVVFIPSAASFDDLMEILDPFLEDSSDFAVVARRKQYATNVKPGKYAIQKGMNNNEIVNTLRSRNIPVKVSFNNQETLADLAGRVAVQIEADSIALYKAFTEKSFLEQYGFDQYTSVAPYIPNTYEFFWNTSAAGFRDRMLKEYQRFWNEDRKQKAAAQGLSENQVISLASIVQKETAKTEERPRVAGVYLNRIRKNMLLQADPTVIFAIKEKTGNYDTVIKRVLYRDLELDSPFNTYKYKGVPPGPITMPDISSIEAVLNPEKHDFYYFVANVENFGYHIFARTLAQHNRNKAQYVRWLNQQRINR